MMTFLFSSQLVLAVGFLTAAVVIVHMIRQRLSPSGTIAWLLVIVLIPYLGIPLYLLLGGRKIRKAAASKADLHLEESSPVKGPRHWLGRLARSFSLPGAVSGNELRLLPNGEAGYAAIVNLIDQARETLSITTFILHNDEVGRDIVARLAARARSGIKVRLLLDGYGSRFTSRRFLASLIQAGGQVAFFMPMLHRPFRGRTNLRNHRKIFLADRRHVVAGGINIAAEYIGATADPLRWQDLAFVLDGPAAERIGDIFRSDWLFATGEVVLENQPEPLFKPKNPGTTVQVVPSGPDVPGDPLYAAILSAVYAAQHRLWIVTPYFIPDEALNNALCIAAHRGVDVRIMVPTRSNHVLADAARGTYLREVQASGGRVFLYPTGMLHAKSMLMDHEMVMLGSANFDLRSLFLNYEVAFFVYRSHLLDDTEQWMRKLMEQSREGVSHEVGAWREILEGLVRVTAPLL